MLVNIQDRKDQEFCRAVSDELNRLGYTEDSSDYKEARLLLTASLLDDLSTRRLVQLTGFDEEFVAEIADRMERSKLWVAGKAETAEWEHETHGAICFLMHVAVARGDLERTDELRNDQYVYRSLIFDRKAAVVNNPGTEFKEPECT